MPAPPPNGVSSTCPPLSGVCSRKLTQLKREPAASTLATWRCAENHSNHSGNSVKTSISIIALALGRRADARQAARAEEVDVDVDAARRGIDLADRVCDHRHEQRLAARRRASHLERLARGQLDQPR